MAKIKWMALVVAVAAFGGWACGDDGGGGSKTGNICDKDSSSFKAEECLVCLGALLECQGGDLCSAENDAVLACQNDAYGDCSAGADEATFEACMQQRCGSLRGDYVACVKRDCSKAAACAAEA